MKLINCQEQKLYLLYRVYGKRQFSLYEKWDRNELICKNRNYSCIQTDSKLSSYTLCDPDKVLRKLFVDY